MSIKIQKLKYKFIRMLSGHRISMDDGIYKGLKNLRKYTNEHFSGILNTSEEDLRYALREAKQNNTTIFVALDKKKVVGTASLTIFDNDVIYFGSMFVLPEYRGQGIAKKLLYKRFNYINDRDPDTIVRTSILGGGKYYPTVTDRAFRLHPDSIPMYHMYVKEGFTTVGLDHEDEGPIIECKLKDIKYFKLKGADIDIMWLDGKRL